MFNSSFTHRFKDAALICQTDAEELPSVTSQIPTNVFGWGGRPHAARSSRVKTRFARHQRLSTCSTDPLTSKQRQVTTWGEVRPSVEPVSDSEFALTVMLPWGNVPLSSRQAAAQLPPSEGARMCRAASAQCGKRKWRCQGILLRVYISLQDLNEKKKKTTTLKLTASPCLL